MTALLLAPAACGAPKGGVAVAPLRAGPAPVRFEQSRPAMDGLLLIRVVAPGSQESRVERALGRAFEEIESRPASIAPAVDAASASLRSDGFDDFMVGWSVMPSGDAGRSPSAAYYAGDAGGEAWSARVVDARGRLLAILSVRDGGLASYPVEPVNGSVVDAGAAGAAGASLSSVTVLAPDASQAREYGRSAFAAGADGGPALLLLAGMQGIFALRGERNEASVLVLTEGLEGQVDLSPWKGEVRWAGADGRRAQ